jgi:hypothetical protein
VQQYRHPYISTAQVGPGHDEAGEDMVGTQVAVAPMQGGESEPSDEHGPACADQRRERSAQGHSIEQLLFDGSPQAGLPEIAQHLVLAGELALKTGGVPEHPEHGAYDQGAGEHQAAQDQGPLGPEGHARLDLSGQADAVPAPFRQGREEHQERQSQPQARNGKGPCASLGQIEYDRCDAEQRRNLRSRPLPIGSDSCFHRRQRSSPPLEQQLGLHAPRPRVHICAGAFSCGVTAGNPLGPWIRT